MKENTACDELVARLDDLLAGGLPPDEREACLEHAGRCPECEALLRALRSVRQEAEEEIAGRAPAGLVAGIWPRVDARLAARAPRDRTWALRLAPALVPALAAAVLLLLLGTGLLLSEVRRLGRDQAALRESVALQSPAGAMFALQGGAQRPASAAAGMTVAELLAWLAAQPHDAVVVPARRQAEGPGATLEERAVLRRARSAGVRLDDGLSAGEALRLLQMLDLEPDRPLPDRGRVVLGI